MVGCLPMLAQKRGKFDPVKFEADLEQFITIEARLTTKEASLFLPKYREMRKKQLVYFKEARNFNHVDINSEKACADAIRRRDKNDIEIKRLQQKYHEKFLEILPASKVFLVLKAENKFHRQLFKKGNNRNGH